MKSKKTGGRLSGRDHAAVRMARSLGLFLLVESAKFGPKWLLYSKTTGAVVLTFFPSTGKYFAGDEQGHCHWAEAIKKAAALAAGC